MKGTDAGALARQALALARAGVSSDDAVPTLLRTADHDAAVVELAYSRALAALDATPGDTRVPRALAFLNECRQRLG